MSMQIAVRLPDQMVNVLDSLVKEGRAPSRAAVVTTALEREFRRILAEQDAEVLLKQGAADELDSLVEWSTSNFVIED